MSIGIESKLWMAWEEKRISSSAVLLETVDGKLLVVKANYKSYWGLPGGLIDKDETPLQAAIRETSEEIGVTLTSKMLTFVSVVSRASKDAHTYQFIFKAQITNELIQAIQLQASEIDEFALVTRDQVKTGDREYAAAVQNWVMEKTGYSEQVIIGTGGN